jgi:hypothetical protein
MTKKVIVKKIAQKREKAGQTHEAIGAGIGFTA